MTAVAENRTILKTSNGRQLIVAEQTTLQLAATLVDELGAALPLAGLTTLTLTLYNRDSSTQEIINGVSGVNILNTGRGTMHPTSGLLTITLEPADNAIIDAAQDVEWHRALLVWTYSVNRIGRYEIDFRVRNVSKVA